ncbi:hypothetical protein JHW43_006058 [Diplocarpon mali]|nr:hypothetical protein JHW43_006058 [Diplocarpon mali]
MGLARLPCLLAWGPVQGQIRWKGGWPRPELGSRRPVAVGETAAREGRLKIARENRERGCGGRNGARGADEEPPAPSSCAKQTSPLAPLVPLGLGRPRSQAVPNNQQTWIVRDPGTHPQAMQRQSPAHVFQAGPRPHSCSGTEGERGLPVTSTWPRHGTATAASPATPQSHESEREGESDEAAHLHDPLSPGFGPAARRHVGTWGMYSPCPAASPLRARRRNGPGARGITRAPRSYEGDAGQSWDGGWGVGGGGGGDAVRRETLASASPGSCVASSWSARPRPQGFLCVGVPDLP